MRSCSFGICLGLRAQPKWLLISWMLHKRHRLAIPRSGDILECCAPRSFGFSGGDAESGRDMRVRIRESSYRLTPHDRSKAVRSPALHRAVTLPPAGRGDRRGGLRPPIEAPAQSPASLRADAHSDNPHASPCPHPPLPHRAILHASASASPSPSRGKSATPSPSPPSLPCRPKPSPTSSPR